MNKYRFFTFFAIIVATFIVMSSKSASAHANTILIGTPVPTNTPINDLINIEGEVASSEEQEELKSVIQSYVELRYRTLSLLESSNSQKDKFGYLISDMAIAKTFMQGELAKLALEVKRAELNQLKYVSYDYFLDFRSITIDSANQTATVIVVEENEVVYEISAEINSENPIVSRTAGIEHTIMLDKVKNEWKIISDTYNDDLWRMLKRDEKSPDEIIDAIDEMMSILEASPLSTLGGIKANPLITVSENYDVSSHTYDRAGAVEYALAHWNLENYNTKDYYTFTDTDCQNFVSQALYEGGNITMYIPDPINLSSGGPGWYYLNYDLSGISNGTNQVGAGWTDVERFFLRATDPNEALAYNQGPKGVLLDERLGTDPDLVPAGLMLGDIIQFEWLGTQPNGQEYDHTAIVVAIENGIPYVAAHTNDMVMQPYTALKPWESIRFLHIEKGNGSPQVEVEISSSVDDAGGNAFCVYSTLHNEIYLGACTNNGNIISGFKFDDVQIPKNAQIQYAFLKFTTDGPYSTPININLYAEDNGNSLDFSLSQPTSRIILDNPPSSPILWNITEPWSLNMRRVTPNLSTLLQNVVNRNDWVYGNSISFITKNADPNSSNIRRVIAFDRANIDQSLSPAKLIVAYGLDTVTSPTVQSVARASASPTNAASVDFIIIFSEPVMGVDINDFDLITEGVASATKTGITGSGNVYTVTVNTGSGDGKIYLNVKNSNTGITAVGDGAGLNGGYQSGEEYTIDKTSPTVLSILRDSFNPTSAGSVSYLVTFSEIVTGVDVNDFNLTSNNLAGVGIAHVTPITGATYRVFVAINYGNGTLQLHLVDNDTILDRATNPLSGVGIGNGNLSGEVYDVNRNPVTLNSTPSGPAVTNASIVNFMVTFSESVTGVDANDFTLTTVGVTNASVTSVSGSGSTYTVSVNTGVGDGTIRLDIIDNDTILNSSSVPLVEEFITGQSVTIDKSQPWNTFLGGNGNDRSYAVVAEPTGNFYVSGVSSEGWGSPIRAYSGGDDIFVAKVDSSGNLMWNTFLGGANSEGYGYEIALDENGNVYVIGSSSSNWGSPIQAYTNLGDGFVAKLSPSGNLLWNTFIGGSAGYDTALGIKVRNGIVYVVGNSSAGFGNPINAYTAGNESYLASLNANTGSLNWHTFFGGNGEDLPVKVYLSNSNIYVAGYGNGTWGNPVQAHSVGTNNDGYVAKFNSSGTLLWNTFLGADGYDIAYAIDENSTGDLYVAGRSSTTWGDPLNIYAGGSIDAFVAELNPNTGTLLWHRFVGGSGADFAWSLEVDSQDNINIAGSGDATWGSPVRTHAGDYEGFYAKLSPTGGLLVNSFVGGSGADRGYGIVLGTSNDIYLAGYSTATWDNPIRAYTNSNDAYLAKINITNLPLIVSSVTRNNASPTNATTISFTVTFSEPVTGVDINDFNLNTTGITGASISNVTGTDAIYTVNVNTGSGDGTIRLDLVNNGTILDNESNPLAGSFATGQPYVIDKTTPTVLSSVRTIANPNSSGLNFIVTFSESVTGVDVSDFGLTTTGVTGTSISSVSGSGNTYTVNVNSGTGSGTVKLNIVDNDTIVDAASNPLGGVGAGNGSYTTGQSFTVTAVTFNSLGTQDGHILESTENSGVGGTVNSTGTSFVVGDDATDKQYMSIMHFDTTTLPDTVSIASATVKVMQQGTVTGTNPFTTHGSLMVDIQKPYFGTSNSLVIADFQATAGQSNVATFNSTPVSSWYSAFINSSGYVQINLTGTTQFRIRFSLDDNDDTGADYIAFSSGNNTTVANRPQLIIQYYTP